MAFRSRPAAGLTTSSPRRSAPSVAIAGAFFAIAIVVDVEAAVEAETRVEDERADERARAIAGTLEHVASVGSAGPRRKRPFVRTPWTRRRRRGEDRGMRRQRQRRGRIGARELEPFGREPIQARRQPGGSAERAHAIGAQRVDRDQQHVAAAAGAGRQKRRAAEREEPDRRADQGNRGERRERKEYFSLSASSAIAVRRRGRGRARPGS